MSFELLIFKKWYSHVYIANTTFSYLKNIKTAYIVSLSDRVCADITVPITPGFRSMATAL